MKEWDEKDSMPDKIHFERTSSKGKRMKGRVTPGDGSRGPKFLLGVTLTGFNELQSEFAYTNHKKWAAWQKCLQGEVKTVWDEVVEDDYKDRSSHTTDEFKKAVDKFLTKILHCDYS